MTLSQVTLSIKHSRGPAVVSRPPNAAIFVFPHVARLPHSKLDPLHWVTVLPRVPPSASAWGPRDGNTVGWLRPHAPPPDLHGVADMGIPFWRNLFLSSIFAQYDLKAGLTPLLPAAAIALLTVAINFVVDWFLHKTSGLHDE